MQTWTWKAKINPRSREGGLRHGIHLSRCSTSLPQPHNNWTKVSHIRSSNLARSPGHTSSSPSDCQPFSVSRSAFPKAGPWPSSDSQRGTHLPFYLRPPDRSGSSGGHCISWHYKDKSPYRHGFWGGTSSEPSRIPWECGPGLLWGAPRTGKCRSSSTSRDFAQIKAFPSRALVPVFGHAEWALESSGLWTERREEGWGIFVECQRISGSLVFPGPPTTAGAEGLVKNLYILNYILLWGGDFPPSHT